MIIFRQISQFYFVHNYFSTRYFNFIVQFFQSIKLNSIILDLIFAISKFLFILPLLFSYQIILNFFFLIFLIFFQAYKFILTLQFLSRVFCSFTYSLFINIEFFMYTFLLIQNQIPFIEFINSQIFITKNKFSH